MEKIRWEEKQFSMIKQTVLGIGGGQLAAGVAVYFLCLKDHGSVFWIFGNILVASAMAFIPFIAESSKGQKKRWVDIYDTTLCAMVALWAYSTLKFFASFSPDTQTAYAIILAGIAATVTISFFHRQRTALILIWGLITPFSYTTFALMETPSYALSTLSIVFAWTLSYQQYLLHKMLRTDFRLGQENQKLFYENQMNTKSLVQSSKMVAVAQMTGGIAHEINNPLTIISSAAATMRKTMETGSPEPKMIDYCLNSIEKTASRIAKIVHGLRVISRDQKQNHCEDFSTEDLHNDVYGLCSEKLKAHGVQFKSNITEGDVPATLHGDQVQISQVLLNLVVNAFDVIKNTKSTEKWIAMDFSLRNEQIVIQVIDSGPGVPMQIVEKIFDPFITSKPVGEGTGLGLYLSRSIAVQHGGTLELRKVKGHTCFELRLPEKPSSDLKNISQDDPSLKSAA